MVLVPRRTTTSTKMDETLEVKGSTSEIAVCGPQLEVSGVVVTIRDDDTAGVTVKPTVLSVVEGGSNSYGVSSGHPARLRRDGRRQRPASGTGITLSGDPP